MQRPRMLECVLCLSSKHLLIPREPVPTCQEGCPCLQ